MDLKEVRELLTMEFPDDEVRHRPEVWCKTCAEGIWQCDEHTVAPCTLCGQEISAAHIHHPYIPIGYVEARLADVDPDWSWKPMALDHHGLPLFDGGCFWIQLTIHGRTEIGVGDARGDIGAQAKKKARAAAIKDAAAAFGVGRYLRALDREKPPVTLRPQPPRAVPDDPATVAELLRWIKARGREQKMTPAEIEAAFLAHTGGRTSLDRASMPILAGYKDHLKQEAAKVRGGAA